MPNRAFMTAVSWHLDAIPVTFSEDILGRYIVFVCRADQQTHRSRLIFRATMLVATGTEATLPCILAQPILLLSLTRKIIAERRVFVRIVQHPLCHREVLEMILPVHCQCRPTNKFSIVYHLHVLLTWFIAQSHGPLRRRYIGCDWTLCY